MQRSKGAILTTAVILGIVVIAGVLGVSLQASESANDQGSRYPNDRANHHPVNPNQ